MRHGHAHDHAYAHLVGRRLIIRSGDNFADIVADKFRAECGGSAKFFLHKKLIKSDREDEQELLSRQALCIYIYTRTSIYQISTKNNIII